MISPGQKVWSREERAEDEEAPLFQHLEEEARKETLTRQLRHTLNLGENAFLYYVEHLSTICYHRDTHLRYTLPATFSWAP